MFVLCFLAALGMLAIFVMALITAVGVMGWCIKTLFALALTVAIAGYLIGWLRSIWKEDHGD